MSGSYFPLSDTVCPVCENCPADWFHHHDPIRLCPRCDGSGVLRKLSGPTKCPRCKGKGWVKYGQ